MGAHTRAHDGMMPLGLSGLNSDWRISVFSVLLEEGARIIIYLEFTSERIGYFSQNIMDRINLYESKVCKYESSVQCIIRVWIDLYSAGEVIADFPSGIFIKNTAAAVAVAAAWGIRRANKKRVKINVCSAKHIPTFIPYIRPYGAYLYISNRPGDTTRA